MKPSLFSVDSMMEPTFSQLLDGRTKVMARNPHMSGRQIISYGKQNDIEQLYCKQLMQYVDGCFSFCLHDIIKNSQ